MKLCCRQAVSYPWTREKHYWGKQKFSTEILLWFLLFLSRHKGDVRIHRSRQVPPRVSQTVCQLHRACLYSPTHWCRRGLPPRTRGFVLQEVQNWPYRHLGAPSQLSEHVSRICVKSRGPWPGFDFLSMTSLGLLIRVCSKSHLVLHRAEMRKPVD